MSKEGKPTVYPEARILFVDDDVQVRIALARLLELLGYHVDEASSGEQALQLMESTPYDVAILDILMPGMDGIEVMHRARQTYPDLAVVFLTGHGSVESAAEAVRSHAADYLLKPVSNRELAAAVARALQQRPRQEQPQMPATSEQFLEVGGVTLDRKRRMVIVAGREGPTGFSVKLTGSESALLACLMQRPGVAIPCRQLAWEALDYSVGDEEASAIIRPHISRLRKKIEPDPIQPCLIRTVRDKRYLFNPHTFLSSDV
ncbi:MAG: response regulator transcription factor [Anaerolineae bacterium]|nr:response regulator transcription factor [Anaerolineae bacterium]